MNNKNLKKNFLWNTIGVGFNSFTSLFYMIIVTRINGSDIAGIFTFAFSFALLLEVIGQYSGRAFQVSETNKKIKDSDYVYNRIICSIIMIIVSLVFSFIRSYDSYKFILIMLLVLFRAIESVGDSLFGIIQKNDDLYKVGISFFIKSILNVSIFLIIDLLTHNLIISCLAILIIQTLITLLYDLRNVLKYNFKFNKFNKDNMKYVFRTGLYTFIFLILTQYLVGAPKYIIDYYLSNTDQTIFGIISMPASVMLMFAALSIQPCLTTLIEYLKEKQYNLFEKLVFKIISFVSILGVIGTFFCYFFGTQILSIIYGLDLTMYKLELAIVLIAATLYSIVSILSSSLITMRKTAMQDVMFGIGSVYAFVSSIILIKNYNFFGSYISYISTMFIIFIMFIIYFKYIISKIKK